MTKKIIHIVENLDKGAVENWIVNSFIESRKIEPDWEWTFYCILGRPGRLDGLVQQHGGTIIFAPTTISDKFKFLKHLRTVLKQGQYDVLHAHHDYLSGFYLLASLNIRFSKRILHIHNTDKWLPIGNSTIRNLLLKPCRFLGIKLVDTVVGISKDTLSEFVQHSANGRKKGQVLYYGVELSRFRSKAIQLREELGISSNSKILVFVGRMNEFKNPAFVVDVLNELCKSRDDVFAVFVGAGGEADNVLRKAKDYGIEDRVKLLGFRNDIPQIMQQADLFVFPRVEYPREGLGLVVVEAQAAGLPMLLSYGIVEDAVVIPSLVKFIKLDNNPEEWARMAANYIQDNKPIDSETAVEIVEKSHFGLRNGTLNLLSLYR